MGKNDVCGNGGCGCSSATTKVGVEEKFVAQKEAAKVIDLEFLYLDLDVCEKCRGSESNLDAALAEVSEVLRSTGVQVNLQKTHVKSYEQALALNFMTSPTIRINGQDIAFEVKENYCSSCSNLSGTETYCRVWSFDGEEFSTVPKSLVIEMIFKEIYGGKKKTTEISPERKAESEANLKRFFAGVKPQEKTARTETTTTPVIPITETTNSSGCGCS